MLLFIAFDNQDNENEEGVVDLEVELLAGLEEIENMSKEVGMTTNQLEDAKNFENKTDKGEI